MSEPRAIFVVIWIVLGCANTSGNEWLNSPVDQQPPVERSAAYENEVEQRAPEQRPRLSHTVTLGESYADAAPSAAPAGNAPPAVQVNVHTPVIVNNYGGYSYGYGSWSYARPARASGELRIGATTQAPARGMPTQVGGNFPAPPDYGPKAFR